VHESQVISSELQVMN